MKRNPGIGVRVRIESLVAAAERAHGLGVYRLDDRVRVRRQEDVDVVRTGDQIRLRATVATKFSPDARRRRTADVRH
jgi:hypothetical protein